MQIFKIFLTLFLGNLVGLSVNAEEKPSKIEIIQFDKNKVQQPYNWVIWKDQVKPEDKKIYEEKAAGIINKAKDYPSFIRILTFFENSTSTYYFFYPYLNMNDWSKIYSFWSDEAEKVGIKKHLVNYSLFLTKSLPEISQFPSSGQISLSHSNYVHMEHFQIYPESEEKFIELFKEWSKQTQAKAPECGWFVQKMIVSENLPTYMIMWGDCLKNSGNILDLNRFFLEKQAYGTIIKKIIAEEKIYLPKLSTSPLDLSGK